MYTCTHVCSRASEEAWHEDASIVFVLQPDMGTGCFFVFVFCSVPALMWTETPCAVDNLAPIYVPPSFSRAKVVITSTGSCGHTHTKRKRDIYITDSVFYSYI